MTRMVVVLPAPLGPRKPKISPSLNFQVQRIHGREPVVVFGEVHQFNHV